MTLKNRINEYVRAAAAGEAVRVTVHGEVVAELVSPHVGLDASPDDRVLCDLLQQGLLSPARVPSSTPPPPGKPATQFDRVLHELEASRAER